jgi:hypothetical protein
MNRDENPDRVATAPQLVSHGQGISLTTLWPTDLRSGGTWIGVSSEGVIACLMNASPQVGYVAPTQPRSRGEIIPSVLTSTLRARTPLVSAAALRASEYPPFRLLIIDHKSISLIRPSPTHQAMLPPTVLEEKAVLFASSGLGDEAVEVPRRELFGSMLSGDILNGSKVIGQPPDPLEAQYHVHRHRWEQAPHLSVLMLRSGARTVSRTTIDLTDCRANMTHESLDESGENVSISYDHLTVSYVSPRTFSRVGATTK